MTSAANGVSAKPRGIRQLAPLAPKEVEKSQVAQMATKLAIETLASPQHGSTSNANNGPVAAPKTWVQKLPPSPKSASSNGSPSGSESRTPPVKKSWVQMLAEKQSAQKSTTPPPVGKDSPIRGGSPMSLDSNSPSSIAKAMSLDSDSPSNKAGACSFHYVINAPIPNKDAASVRAGVHAVMECCEALYEADPSRTFSIVIGLNKKEGNGNTDASLAEAAATYEAEFAKTWKGKIAPPRVAGFTWKPVGDDNTAINFVDFRNRTYYHDKTQQAIKEAIPTPQNCKGAVQVKLLSLDADSQVTPEQLNNLEKRWQEANAPLITSGFYEFNFQDVPVSLTDDPRHLEWPGFLMACENEVDHTGKQKLAARTFAANIRYQNLSPAIQNAKDEERESQLRVLARHNLIIFETSQKTPTQATKVLMPLYQGLLNNLQSKKEIVEDKAERKGKEQELKLLDLRIAADIKDIVKAEGLFGQTLKSLTGTYKMKGEQCLYPSENALFVTLFEHNGKDQHFNLWDTTCVFGPKRPQNPILIWGTCEGASEGQNIALQIRRLWRKTPHEKMQRKLVEFSWTFTTVVHPRCLETPDWALKKLPKTSSALFHKGINDKLEKVIAGFLTSRSQSSLSKYFPKQRCGFVNGLCVGETAYRYSMIPRHVRSEASNMLFHELTEFNQEQLEKCLALVKKKIDLLAAEQGKR